jgi:hypothetical protein
VRALASLRSWLSPPAATADDEAALARHLDDLVRFYGQGCALVLNLLHLVFWPTDPWLLPDPRVRAVMHWLRGVGRAGMGSGAGSDGRMHRACRPAPDVVIPFPARTSRREGP